MLQHLEEEGAAAASAMDTAPVDAPAPQNHNAAFPTLSATAEAADRVTRDYRSVFNAYIHQFHQPKPPMGELVATQGTITQSFAKR